MRTNKKRRRGTPGRSVADSSGHEPSRIQRLAIDLAAKKSEPLLLLLFGIFLSILYFGHQIVPNSDFVAFVQTGKEILSFQKPHSFKRLPGLGILQVLMSYFFGGSNHTLTAGVFLNSLLLAFCGLLFYGISRRIFKRGAFWISLLAMINPWVIQWSLSPIVEMPLIFFTLLTFYLLFEHGRWAYTAAFAASMMRYEGAVLIPIVFVWDILQHRRLRQRLAAAGLAFCAGLPVAIWVLSQFLEHKTGGSNYVGQYQRAMEGAQMIYKKFFTNLWSESIGPYFRFPNEGLTAAAGWIIRIFLLICGVLVPVWSILKKRWDVLSVFVFAVIYVALHSTRIQTMPRYAVPVLLPVFLLFVYGLKSLWEIATGKLRIPPAVILGLQVSIFIIGTGSAVWIGSRMFSQAGQYSPQSISVPFVALGIGLILCLIQGIRSHGRELGFLLAALGLSASAIASNQALLSRQVGTGYIDQEFKQLANWYMQNSEPGTRLATTLPHVVKLFVPETRQKNITYLHRMRADTLSELYESCKKNNITYLAWDSRIGLIPQNTYYRRWKMDRFTVFGPRTNSSRQMIPPPNKIGPFELVDILQNPYYPNRFISIFKVHYTPTQPAEATGSSH